MPRYTTYQSIYNKPVARSWREAFGFSSVEWTRRLIKIVFLLILLTMTGTGVVSAFAAAKDGDSHVKETVIVMPGDTLWEIAVAHKPRGKDTRVYVEAIKRANGLAVSDIHPGDMLVIPD